jgi:hypothetical protein
MGPNAAFARRETVPRTGGCGGLRDPTGEIAREFGARVFPITWLDDFAAEGPNRSPGRADSYTVRMCKRELRLPAPRSGRSVGACGFNQAWEPR